MSTIRIATNFNIDLEFPVAPFHKRLIAWFLDVLVLSFYVFIVIKIIESLSMQKGFVGNDEGLWAMAILLIIPIFTYHLICEVLMNGQSIGKRLMGLRVVNENGGKPSTSQYIIRWLIRTSDYMAVVIILYSPFAVNSDPSFFWKIATTFGLFVADIILVNATKKHQRLGDILAHTLLIQTTQKADIDDTIFLQVSDTYKPTFPQVMMLSDRDINALKGILDAAKRQQDYNLAERASEKIKSHLNIESNLSPFDFLEILLKDYNYLSTN